MKVALIGYGKMGKAIEPILLKNNHELALIADQHNLDELTVERLSAADVAIEFTTPQSAIPNINLCFEAGVPVVVGTTGWYQQLSEVETLCRQKNGGLLYATNFSLGVNIFFEVNKLLASLMNPHAMYEVGISETHHTAKLDAPSGTAISLADQILERLSRKKHWVNHPTHLAHALAITSIRQDPAPGTHAVRYHSAADTIEIIHTAHSREGFAAGAVAAAEFMAGKTGIYSMRHVLGLD
jgi:4-hydroxy-tetrahydrodipicolinate reductase